MAPGGFRVWRRIGESKLRPGLPAVARREHRYQGRVIAPTGGDAPCAARRERAAARGGILVGRRPLNRHEILAMATIEAGQRMEQAYGIGGGRMSEYFCRRRRLPYTSGAPDERS